MHTLDALGRMEIDQKKNIYIQLRDRSRSRAFFVDFEGPKSLYFGLFGGLFGGLRCLTALFGSNESLTALCGSNGEELMCVHKASCWALVGLGLFSGFLERKFGLPERWVRWTGHGVASQTQSDSQSSVSRILAVLACTFEVRARSQ